jgi:hypothetical protein
MSFAKVRLSILTTPNPKQTKIQKKYSPLSFLEEHFRTARYGIYILLKPLHTANKKYAKNARQIKKTKLRIGI